MKSGLKKLALFVPTFNSENSVVSVLNRIPAELREAFSAIYVFDNGSSDQTIDRVINFAKHNPQLPIQVFRNQENYLLGGSTVLAIRQALQNSFDYLICMHSDGQADPNDLGGFVTRCQADKYDFILGSRLMPDSKTGEYSRTRLWANQFFARIQQPILRSKIFDLGAYVAFNLHTLKTLPFDRVPTDMAYHPNLILNLARASKEPLRFAEFPIHWGAVRSTSVNVYTYALRHFIRILKLYLRGANLSCHYGGNLHSVRVWPIE